MAKRTIITGGADNVAIAVENLLKGETHEGVTLVDDIPAGHKFALADISEGEKIIRCANPVAKAVCDIPAGAHVHTHNAVTSLGGHEYTYTPMEYIPGEEPPKSFNGYVRDNGGVGIRNELWIIPVAGCVSGQAELILKTFKNRFGIKGFDGVFAFTHPYGGSQRGGDMQRTLLQKLIRNPNAGGVLVIGLGGVEEFRMTLGGVNSNRVKFLDCSEVEDEIESGVQLLNQIAEVMKLDSRELCDISKLKIGLKCGGSDRLCTITANPLLGAFTDYLVSAGGTAVLGEVPETFGAEQLIMNRAKDEQTFEKIVSLINGFKDYFRANGQSVYENPSPAQIADGITTIEEKSVVCLQKAGSTPVQDVVVDDGFVTEKGLNLLSAPDDDMCGVTNLAAAGCQMVLFATGLGTPVGGAVPVIKISSNSKLAKRKSNWIDFNAGAVLDTDYVVQLEKLVDLTVAVAGGKLTRNEINNTREIAIFKSGIIT